MWQCDLSMCHGNGRIIVGRTKDLKREASAKSGYFLRSLICVIDYLVPSNPPLTCIFKPARLFV